MFSQICLAKRWLTDKKTKTNLDGFIKIVNASNLKPSKLWIN